MTRLKSFFSITAFGHLSGAKYLFNCVSWIDYRGLLARRLFYVGRVSTEVARRNPLLRADSHLFILVSSTECSGLHCVTRAVDEAASFASLGSYPKSCSGLPINFPCLLALACLTTKLAAVWPCLPTPRIYIPRTMCGCALRWPPSSGTRF